MNKRKQLSNIIFYLMSLIVMLFGLYTDDTNTVIVGGVFAILHRLSFIREELK